MYKRLISILPLLLLVLSACSGSKPIPPGNHLVNVIETDVGSAEVLPFPNMESLASINQVKKTDVGSFNYSLVETTGNNMQMAVSWGEKTWEFRGECTHNEMRVKLVKGQKSLKNGEQNEWLLLPPNSMKFVFTQTDSQTTKEVIVSCKELTWFYNP